MKPYSLSRWLSNIEHVRPRRIGYTTGVANLAKHLDGTVVCYNKSDAKRVAEEHKTRTISLEQNFLGSKGPYFLDSMTFIGLSQKVAELEAEAQKFHDLKVLLFKEEGMCPDCLEDRLKGYTICGDCAANG